MDFDAFCDAGDRLLPLVGEPFEEGGIDGAALARAMVLALRICANVEAIGLPVFAPGGSRQGGVDVYLASITIEWPKRLFLGVDRRPAALDFFGQDDALGILHPLPNATEADELREVQRIATWLAFPDEPHPRLWPDYAPRIAEGMYGGG